MATAAAPLSSSPEQIMSQRGGSVLDKKTILKSDHFPGCQNKRLTPHIDGAPNYRQMGSLSVHGVAIPTIDGIRNVLDHIGGKTKKVLWHNLREEPVVYINGRPFVLRDVERPFSNLEYTGINRARVEQMESRLKEDILFEARRYDSKILVTDELPDGQMVDQWESVIDSSVKTPLEVYRELHFEGYLVDYERVPITDEKSPKERDFDILVHSISQVDIGTEIIFNCQMGRGRTTTGMVIATLVYFNRIGASGVQVLDICWKMLSIIRRHWRNVLAAMMRLGPTLWIWALKLQGSCIGRTVGAGSRRGTLYHLDNFHLDYLHVSFGSRPYRFRPSIYWL